MTSNTSKLALSLIVAVCSPLAHAQGRTDQSLASLDAQSRLAGESFATRAQALNERITRGWPAGSVRAVMGEPERIQRSLEGRDQVEVWGYNGFDVRVQLRNGLVETWFVRFAQ